MRKIIFFFVVVSFFCLITNSYKANDKNEVIICYINQKPFAFKSKNKLVGIEIDILKDFEIWVNTIQNNQYTFKYKEFNSFQEFYKYLTTSKNLNIIGAGSTTITDLRKKKVNFTPPYLKNLSLLISNKNIDFTTDNKKLKEALKNKNGYKIESTTGANYLDNLKNKFNIDFNIKSLKDPNLLFNTIAEDPNGFGYMDIINFWLFMSNNKKAYIKIHRHETLKNEYFGFLTPKNSSLESLLNNFFSRGFGYTSTKNYDKILKKYLGHEIINEVEIKSVLNN